MAKKQKQKKKKPVIRNAFKCKICGKVVPPVHRSRHLIVAHKLSGYNVDSHFIDMGTPFVIGRGKINYLMREYEKNQERTEPQYLCGAKVSGPQPIKLIYTPMGNKR